MHMSRCTCIGFADVFHWLPAFVLNLQEEQLNNWQLSSQQQIAQFD